MKKQIITAAILIQAALMLSACAAQNVSVTETVTAAEQTETTVTTAETTVTTKTTTAAAVTTSETPVSETVTETSAEPYDWSGFVLKDHCGEFDEAMPLKYHSWEYTDEPEIEESHYNAAYQAVIESAYYDEVLKFGKERFEWNGNEFVTSEDDFHFILQSYPYYIDYDAAPELVLKPKFISCVQLPFDGVNTEEIMLFRFPLAESQLEWSGTSSMHIVVYVNFKGEAEVLYNVSAQTLSTQIKPIKYSDGKIHLDFGRGHTAGTSRSHILSFSNGEAKVEYVGIATFWEEDGFILRNDISGFFDQNILLFRDGIRDCYCEIKKVALSDEISKAICADEKVNAEYFSSEFSEPVYALGGQYIVTGAGAFEFDNGMIVPYENGVIVPSFEYEGIPALNVDLTSEAFN
ncbi:MAG: hypothetical protein IJZ72_05225 [Oscillospiraceae bacterium]|nr:hypothetical protein [Oscillospiraceae bacterium]